MALHCWTDKRSFMIDTHGWASKEHLDTYGTDPDGDANATCVLEVGDDGRHDGPHVWTPDSDITIAFAPAEAP